jgi:hypothetical protein
MRPQLEIQGVNIVLRGNFNCAVFHPSWFVSQDLLRRQEAEAAKIELIHPQAAIFNIDWLELRVTENRFQVSTIQESYYEILRDLVVGVFRLLNHTPLSVMGINRNFHYGLESKESWHAVGDLLAPKQEWVDVLDKPGMRSLLIEGARPDDMDGYIRVKVEPSIRVRFGIIIEVNDHYQLPSPSQPPTGAEEIVDILSKRWNESMQRSLDIAQKIAGLGELQ